MLIPAFSNKITNVTSKMRLGMLFVFNGLPARGTWQVGTHVKSGWDFPGKNTGVGCHFLLQGIFPTQG